MPMPVSQNPTGHNYPEDERTDRPARGELNTVVQQINHNLAKSLNKKQLEAH